MNLIIISKNLNYKRIKSLMNSDYSQLKKLGKDELIALLFTINTETLKTKKQIIKEVLKQQNGCLILCNNKECFTIMDMQRDLNNNFGFQCENCCGHYCDCCDTISYWCNHCKKVLCDECIDSGENRCRLCSVIVLYI